MAIESAQQNSLCWVPDTNHAVSHFIQLGLGYNDVHLVYMYVSLRSKLTNFLNTPGIWS